MVEILPQTNTEENEVIDAVSKEVADLKEEIINTPDDANLDDDFDADFDSVETENPGPIEFVITINGEKLEKILPQTIDVNILTEYNTMQLINFFDKQPDMNIVMNYTNNKGKSTKVLTMDKVGDVMKITIKKGKKSKEYTINFLDKDMTQAIAKNEKGESLSFKNKRLNDALVILKYGISYNNI